MTSSSTREHGPRFFVSAGMSCIRSLASFLRFFIAHGRGLCSCRAFDNIERLIPFPRQQSNMIERVDCCAMHDKQILIRGATNGIGLAAAEALAALGANLAIAIRSSARQKKARVIPE